jgi:hypothetical protein
MTFGLRISAKDDTSSALRSAKAGFEGLLKAASKPIVVPIQIAKIGLGTLRDINLGLRPLISGLDDMIERGTRLEVVQKSFAAITGLSGRQAEFMARRIVDAASGTIKLAQGMELANRALSSGMGMDQFLTALDFISKKAATTGIEAGTALDKVITGLARGTTLMLDDFGILVDGIDGVKAAFDKIKGAGAFDALGPAAQKAEVVRAAIAEMQAGLSKMGVTGKETVFLWQSIKNEIGDAVDRVTLSIVKSETLRKVLEKIRDVAKSISAHFDQGGSFSDILFGKEGGKSGGVIGLLKAGLMDAGEAFGRLALGGIMKGLSELPDLFAFLWKQGAEFIDLVTPAIEKGLKWLDTTFLPALKQEFKNFVIDIRRAMHGPATGAEDFLFNDGTKSKWRGLEGTAMDTGTDDPLARILMAAGPGNPTLQGMELYFKKALNPAPLLDALSDFAEAIYGFLKRGYSKKYYGVELYSIQDRFALEKGMRGGLSPGMKGLTALELEHPFLAMLAKASEDLRGGGVLGGDSRLMKERKRFLADFPPGVGGGAAGGAAGAIKVTPGVTDIYGRPLVRTDGLSGINTNPKFSDSVGQYMDPVQIRRVRLSNKLHSIPGMSDQQIDALLNRYAPLPPPPDQAGGTPQATAAAPIPQVPSADASERAKDIFGKPQIKTDGYDPGASGMGEYLRKKLTGSGPATAGTVSGEGGSAAGPVVRAIEILIKKVDGLSAALLGAGAEAARTT